MDPLTLSILAGLTSAVVQGGVGILNANSDQADARVVASDQLDWAGRQYREMVNVADDNRAAARRNLRRDQASITAQAADNGIKINSGSVRAVRADHYRETSRMIVGQHRAASEEAKTFLTQQRNGAQSLLDAASQAVTDSWINAAVGLVGAGANAVGQVSDFEAAAADRRALAGGPGTRGSARPAAVALPAPDAWFSTPAASKFKAPTGKPFEPRSVIDVVGGR